MIEEMQWVMLCGAWIFPTVYSFTLQKRMEKLEQDNKVLLLGYSASYELVMAEKNRREQHAKVLQRLTNPESIEQDMEKSARAKEMYDANRTILPRNDAGPPARVYTPQMRAKVPRSNYKRNKS